MHEAGALKGADRIDCIVPQLTPYLLDCARETILEQEDQDYFL
jgi:hypothetical protein